MEFLVTLLDWFEVAAWFLVKAKVFGVVILVVAILLVVAVGAVVANACCSLWRRVSRTTDN